MLDFIVDNLGTILITVVLVTILAAIVVKLVRDKRKGKSSCGGNCAHCALGGSCHGEDRGVVLCSPRWPGVGGGGSFFNDGQLYLST